MKTMHRNAVLFTRIIDGMVVARRISPETGEKEYLFQWYGVEGDFHEVWYPQSVIKLED